MASISPADIGARVRDVLQRSGALDSVKSQLRNQVLAEVVRLHPAAAILPATAVQAPTLMHRVANSLIAAHLESTQCTYTLSVFLPESRTARVEAITGRDVARILSLNPTSRLYGALTLVTGSAAAAQPADSLLLRLLDVLHGEFSAQCLAQETQTDQRPSDPVYDARRLERKLGEVDRQHAARLAVDSEGSTRGWDEQMLSYRRQCDEQLQDQLAVEMDKFRTLELSRLKLEQNVDLRKQLDLARAQLEDEYRLKRERLDMRERESEVALARRQHDVDKEMFAARQKLLETMQRVQLQEDELRRDGLLQNRTQLVQAEAARFAQDALQLREAALNGHKEHFERKLRDEMSAFEAKFTAEHATQTRELARQENQLRDGAALVKFQHTSHQQLVDNLAESKSEVARLRVELQQCSVDRDAAVKSLTQVTAQLAALSDHAALRHEVQHHAATLQVAVARAQDAQAESQRLRDELARSQHELLQALARCDALVDRGDAATANAARAGAERDVAHAAHALSVRENQQLRTVLQQTRAALAADLSLSTAGRLASSSTDRAIPATASVLESVLARLARLQGPAIPVSGVLTYNLQYKHFSKQQVQQQQQQPPFREASQPLLCSSDAHLKPLAPCQPPVVSNRPVGAKSLLHGDSQHATPPLGDRLLSPSATTDYKAADASLSNVNSTTWPESPSITPATAITPSTVGVERGFFVPTLLFSSDAKAVKSSSLPPMSAATALCNPVSFHASSTPPNTEFPPTLRLLQTPFSPSASTPASDQLGIDSGTLMTPLQLPSSVETEVVGALPIAMSLVRGQDQLQPPTPPKTTELSLRQTDTPSAPVAGLPATPQSSIYHRESGVTLETTASLAASISSLRSAAGSPPRYPRNAAVVQVPPDAVMLLSPLPTTTDAVEDFFSTPAYSGWATAIDVCHSLHSETHSLGRSDCDAGIDDSLLEPATPLHRGNVSNAPYVPPTPLTPLTPLTPAVSAIHSLAAPQTAPAKMSSTLGPASSLDWRTRLLQSRDLEQQQRAAALDAQRRQLAVLHAEAAAYENEAFDDEDEAANDDNQAANGSGALTEATEDSLELSSQVDTSKLRQSGFGLPHPTTAAVASDAERAAESALEKYMAVIQAQRAADSTGEHATALTTEFVATRVPVAVVPVAHLDDSDQHTPSHTPSIAPSDMGSNISFDDISTFSKGDAGAPMYDSDVGTAW